MATLEEMARVLREKNPQNRPMYLDWMARQWWPQANWLDTKTTHHNGGARLGARAAGGFAGRLARRGLLRMVNSDGPCCYVWCEPTATTEANHA